MLLSNPTPQKCWAVFLLTCLRGGKEISTKHSLLLGTDFLGILSRRSGESIRGQGDLRAAAPPPVLLWKGLRQRARDLTCILQVLRLGGSL